MNSVTEINRTKISKRISAFLVDLLFFVFIFSVSMLFCNNCIDGYTDAQNKYDEKCLEYNLVIEKTQENGQTYITSWTVYDFMLSPFASSTCKAEKEEDIKEVSDECQLEFVNFLEKQNEEFGKDADAVAAYDLMFKYSVTFNIISAFFALFVVNVVFPLLFKHGQTLGKKLQKIRLVTTKGNDIKTLNLISRFLLGIFMLEVLPFILYISVSNVFVIPLLIGLVITFVNFCIFVFTKNHVLFHDIIGGTVVVDMDVATIYNSNEKGKF